MSASFEKLKKLREQADPLAYMARVLEDHNKNVMGFKGDKGDQGGRGDEGEQGIPGETPIKGVDYFTPEEIDEFTALIQSRVKNGEQGRPGTTPVRGLDYWSKEDQQAIIKEVLGLLPKPKKVVAVDHTAIATEAVKKVIETQGIQVEHVGGLKQTLESLTGYLKRGGFRGGGGKVMAGTNTTVTNNPDGSQTIDATGGGGITTLAATEIPNGLINVFTFATATAQPSYLVIDNVWMKAVTASGNVNWTWNAGTKQATTSVYPAEDIWGVV